VPEEAQLLLVDFIFIANVLEQHRLHVCDLVVQDGIYRSHQQLIPFKQRKLHFSGSKIWIKM
jgi:hypothetical protein